MPAVRWIGAFVESVDTQSHSSVTRSIKYELETAGTVSKAVSIQYAAFKVGRAYIGLLVDKNASNPPKKVYKGDCWSIKTKEGLLKRTRSRSLAKTWETMPVSNAYNEAFTDPTGLVYAGIVVHRKCNRRARVVARNVAKGLGIPFLGTLRNEKKVYWKGGRRVTKNV